MNKIEFFDVVAQVLGLDPSVIDMETSENSLSEWDSFAQLRLFMALEEHYKVSFTTNDIETLTSLGAIYQRLETLVLAR